MTETATPAYQAVAQMTRIPDLLVGDVVTTETGVYRVNWQPTRYDKGALPAGIPCWHIPVTTIAGALRGGLVRTDWDYLAVIQRYTHTSAEPTQPTGGTNDG